LQPNSARQLERSKLLGQVSEGGPSTSLLTKETSRFTHSVPSGSSLRISHALVQFQLAPLDGSDRRAKIWGNYRGRVPRLFLVQEHYASQDRTLALLGVPFSILTRISGSTPGFPPTSFLPESCYAG